MKILIGDCSAKLEKIFLNKILGMKLYMKLVMIIGFKLCHIK
jgi:hypothetical protein